jgi:hypothetical protein
MRPLPDLASLTTRGIGVIGRPYVQGAPAVGLCWWWASLSGPFTGQGQASCPLDGRALTGGPAINCLLVSRTPLTPPTVLHHQRTVAKPESEKTVNDLKVAPIVIMTPDRPSVVLRASKFTERV